MALPHRKQNLARFIPYHELSREQVAKALGTTVVRIANLIQGHVYPTPEECDALERLFGGMPAQVLFDPEMLQYRESWPPPRGFTAAVHAEAKRLRDEAGE